MEDQIVLPKKHTLHGIAGTSGQSMCVLTGTKTSESERY